MKHSPLTGMGGGTPSGTSQEELATPNQGNSVLIWTVGAFCIYGWEYLVCLPQEYRLIWRKKINLSSILYLANRYFGLVQFSIIVTLVAGVWAPSACNRVFYIEPIGGLISIILSQIILGGRVYAVYSKSKRMAFALGLILVIECVVGGIAIAAPTTSPSASSGQLPNSENAPCGARTGPFVWDVVYWTVPLFYDALTFILISCKAYRFWRDQMTNEMLDIIWRDGFLYFLAILSINFVNVIIFLGAPDEIRAVNLPATIMLEIILSCRLVLNLRDTHDQSTHTLDQQKTDGTIIEPVKTPKWAPSTISTPIQSRTPDVYRSAYHSGHPSVLYNEPVNRV